MKELISYIFWRNVHHYWWLYTVAFIWSFITDVYFRNEVRLYWDCTRVEIQDRRRVYLNYTLPNLLKSLSDIYILIDSLSYEIKEIKGVNQ